MARKSRNDKKNQDQEEGAVSMEAPFDEYSEAYYFELTPSDLLGSKKKSKRPRKRRHGR
jgi:hypothetical protein